MAKLPADWIESTPEWKAAFGLIDGEEYLATFGDHRGPIKHLDHEGLGIKKPGYKRRNSTEKSTPPNK